MGNSDWIKPDMSLDQVNNTSDANKPVSTAQQSALDLKQTANAGLTALASITGVQGDIIYHNGTGWVALGAGTSGWYFKTLGAGANPAWAAATAGGLTTLKKIANQTINAGAGVFVDIDQLTFPVVNGTDYAFYFYITFQSAAATTGWKAGVNCPTGALDFWAKSDVIANGAAGVATHTERHNTVRDDMTLLTATVTQAVELAIEIRGRYLCTQNGTFAARFANELANTDLTVRKGSYGWYF